LRAPRANRGFGTDEKHIHTKTTVIDKSNCFVGLLLSKIADCARMRFLSAHNRRSARTGRRPRKVDHYRAACRPASIDADAATIARSARQPCC